MCWQVLFKHGVLPLLRLGPCFNDIGEKVLYSMMHMMMLHIIFRVHLDVRMND